jgi:hypothetical protein
MGWDIYTELCCGDLNERQPERPKSIWEDNIKVNIKETGFEEVD